MFGGQHTIPQDRRYQDTYEDRACGIQQHFHHPQLTRTHEEDVRDNLRPPSYGDNQRQNQLHSPHRITTLFQHDPVHRDDTATSTSHQMSGLEAAHSAADRTHPDNSSIDGLSGLDTAHSAAERNYPDSAPRSQDRRFESAFYRNAKCVRSHLGPAPPSFVPMEPSLDPFDGDVRKYPRFRDRFLLITEAQPNLAPRYKLLYLLQHLRGEPLLLADQPRLSDANYFDIIDLLEERYGDKSRLKQLLLQDLHDLSPPRSTQLSDMTRFHDAAFRIVNDLELLFSEEEMTCYNEMLTDTLLRKLPEAVHSFLYASIISEHDCSVHNMLSGLRHILSRTCSRSATRRPCEDPDIFCRKHDEASSSHTSCDNSLAESLDGSYAEELDEAPEHAAVAANAFTDKHLQERRTCPLCGLLHTAARCISFMTINRRMRRIQKLELCLLCLREGHRAVTCPRRTTDSCRICHKGPHNRAVCMTANGRIRPGERRRSPVCATTGSSVDPQRSDSRRHARKKKSSVGRVDATRASTATKLRQSETQSSSVSTPKRNRKKRSKKRGAALPGRDGTSRPQITSTAESMKQTTADAYGDASLLPARQGRLPTDRCSKLDKSAQFDRTGQARRYHKRQILGCC
ncbi:Pao retrotransposon peptidase family protein [Aphelenchoides avenae]|nr:Pao retrotransposon peptidase family protein [Aphelenchus avenae]